jgi:hypothetical protein
MEVLEMPATWRNGIAAMQACVRPVGAAEPLDLWYRFEGLDRPLDGVSEAMAACLLPACMFEREPLSIPGTISTVFRDNIARAQSVLSAWYPRLEAVDIRPSGIDDALQQRMPGAICCFSGGVDSWYSLLKHETRTTHLLLIRGFDIGLENDALWDAARARAARAAERLGKRLVTCETNLREVVDKGRCRWGMPYDGDFWGECLHGAALASVALLLRRTVGEFIVPATHSHAQIKPWGSSPELDHLWSDGYMAITHDGCEADRVSKVRRIAESDIALETLRVCYHDTAEINCGRCEKCLRTIMALRVCGALDRAAMFPRDIPMAAMHGLVIPRPVRHHYVSLREEARRVGDNELLETVEVILNERLSARHAVASIKQAARHTAVGRAASKLKGRLVRPLSGNAAGGRRS